MSLVSSQKTNKPPFAVFLATTVVVFFCTLSAADSIGFVPDYIDGTAPNTSDSTPVAQTSDNSVKLSDLPQLGETSESDTSAVTPAAPKAPKVAPVRLKIAAIDLDLPVQNIASHDLDVLDAALTAGPVRYEDSAELNEPGNMLIFAHSSHLPIVHNQMYKAFNRIPELKENDTITVVGEDGRNYIYAVTSVRKTDANDAVIDLSVTQGTKLTLSTCDTLTSKSSRFVVEADFVGVVE